MKVLGALAIFASLVLFGIILVEATDNTPAPALAVPKESQKGLSPQYTSWIVEGLGGVILLSVGTRMIRRDAMEGTFAVNEGALGRFKRRR